MYLSGLIARNNWLCFKQDSSPALEIQH